MDHKKVEKEENNSIPKYGYLKKTVKDQPAEEYIDDKSEWSEDISALEDNKDK